MDLSKPIKLTLKKGFDYCGDTYVTDMRGVPGQFPSERFEEDEPILCLKRAEAHLDLPEGAKHLWVVFEKEPTPDSFKLSWSRRNQFSSRVHGRLANVQETLYYGAATLIEHAKHEGYRYVRLEAYQ